MRKAAGYLIGKHDFSCFRAAGCSSKHALRNISKLTVYKANSAGLLAFKFNAPLIKISVQADAFLRHMVRNIVGTLVAVGMGKTHPSNMKYILQSRDRREAEKNAPAQGLFLEKITY
jgi:tRNA pseudouridine38-40 synthase